METVDSLVVVTYYHDVWSTLGGWVIRQVPYQTHLRVVSVLKLVNQYVLVLFLEVQTQVVKDFHAVNDSQYHVVKVE